MSNAPAKLEALHVTKHYPGTVALDDVSVRFDGGRVHALLGKNGAGKSTLVKIFAGTVEPTRGTLRVDGREVRLRGARDAMDRGIATVYQELSLVPALSVAENILLGRMPLRRMLGFSRIDWREAHRAAEAVLHELELNLDPRRPVGELSVAHQQMVEIAKAMSTRPAVLMLDEPTSSLAQHETDVLFALVRRLAGRGVAVLHITHRLQELPRIADTVTVLRDGRLTGVMQMRDATPQRIVQLMFGELPVARRSSPATVRAQTALQVRNLAVRGKLRDVSFSVRAGEIFGIAGMLGSGRTELLRAIFGAEPPDAGDVVIGGGSAVRPASPRQMKRMGVAYTPEDRKADSLVQALSTRENLLLASLDRPAGGIGFTTRHAERPLVQRLVESLGVKVASIEQPVASLSGGNQQKVVIGKWLATCPRVVLLDEPTRGVDVHAKQQVFQIVRDLSAQGVACVVVSSELEELPEVCHRIAILKGGRIEAIFPADECTAEALYVRCMRDEAISVA